MAGAGSLHEDGDVAERFLPRVHRFFGSWQQPGTVASMFKYLLISVAIAPLLVGAIAAKGRDIARSRSALRIGWAAYGALWFGVLYYLRYRWS
jgi:hypothetical protein